MQLTIDKDLVLESSTLVEETKLSGAILRTPDELARIVSRFAASEGWMERVRLRADGRWWERLYQGPDHDIWVISWLPGQSTGFHDHGASSGAFVVVTGVLEEHCAGARGRVVRSGKPRAFGPDYAHDVRNVSQAPAISIHAYSPPLDEMNGYEPEGSELVLREGVEWKADRLEQDWRVEGRRPLKHLGALSIEEMLSAARARLRRLTPNEARDAMAERGAVLVDIRPEGQRAMEGSIAGALVVERNVLEWRFDPASSARLPVATNHDVEVIVFCSEGYSSSLAAATLQDLGLWRATDMVGGFQAWRAMGLPVVPPGNAL
ncbi:MAG: rhodanese-like domain-containing protein [Acidobacteriaceae bacterium]|jgi:rhodanese-related sulfurtransferase/mannose-6-phosphate isomerase-like protein (cupin superfamily)